MSDAGNECQVFTRRLWWRLHLVGEETMCGRPAVGVVTMNAANSATAAEGRVLASRVCERHRPALARGREWLLVDS